MSIGESARSRNRKFWQAKSRYGLIHSSKPDASVNPSSLCLVVYVHGLFGDAGATWGEMPHWVLENAGMDIDVISFAYPSRFWERSSIAQATYHLQTWLETEFAEYSNLIFVTHSCGGLVVKHLLNQSFVSIDRNEQTAQFDTSSSMPVWTRTRRVVNIAVPHEGGTRAMNVLSCIVYPLFYLLSAPGLLLVKLLTQGEKDWGRNRIITSLRRKNRWLLRMEKRFQLYLQESRNAGLPTPVINEICAESDQSVAARDQSIDPIFVRGTHKSVKIPNRSQGPIVGIVAEIIKRYPTDVSLAIAVKTLARINQVNAAASISSLIGGRGSKGFEESTEPTVNGIAGSQQRVCDRLQAVVSQGRAGPEQLLLTGSAGVGKSAVMRALAGQLSCRFLTDPRTFPLPLFVPLQQATVSSHSAASYSWESMWSWWLQWAHSLSFNDTTSFQWLEQKFQQDPVVVIIDGVDDFLANHPEIGFSTFVDVLHRVVDRYAENDQFKVIVSLRKDTRGLRTLIRNPNAVFEILALSFEQAVEQFPRSSEWLSSIRDTPVIEQIMTPLVLSHYQPSVDDRSTNQAMTQTRILSEVIENYLMDTRLAGIRLAEGRLAELEHLFTSLGIIAWLVFYKSRGDISEDEVVHEAGALKQRLQLLADRPHQTTVSHDLRAGCLLLENNRIRSTLLSRTVFISTGPDRFRFIHRTWQELLVAKFFIDSIRGHCFNELANAKMYSGIYRIAGELYQGESISNDHVKGALDTWRNTDKRYITGNLIGFLSWTTTPVEPRAIQSLLDELVNLDGFSRIILIGGLGYRLLVDDQKDTARSDLRRYLLPILADLSGAETVRSADPVVSSLAWCYQKAFAVLFGADEPSGSSPCLGFGEEHKSVALPIVTSMDDNKYSLDEQSRALQRALITPVLDTLNHPMFVIRAVHYIYYLVVAKKHNALDHMASQELSLVLLSGCEFETLVLSFDCVPELHELYARCQRVYDQLENSWSSR